MSAPPREGVEGAMAQVPWSNREECTMCRLCNEIAPETFALDDDDVAYVLDPRGNSMDEIQEAMDSCPSSSIIWIEDTDPRAVYPQLAA